MTLVCPLGASGDDGGSNVMRHGYSTLLFLVCGLLLLAVGVYYLRKLFLTITTPYNVRESAGWVIRNITGLGKKNAGIVKTISSPRILNDGAASECRIAVIGDIMSMRGRRLMVSEDVKEYIRDCDYLLGNFEATITDIKKKKWSLAMDERHDRRIMDMLEDMFPAARTYLAISNNHAGDFGEKEYFKSVEMLESRGFNVFGWTGRPYFDINDHLRVIPGTAWSNRPCSHISLLENAETHVKPGAFNLLYPHFGYELELYPRPETVERGKKLLSKFDALIGHHPHYPQAVTAEPAGDGTHKLLAYSLGDFCGGIRNRIYQYGMVVKTNLGRNKDGKWLFGKVEWCFTRCFSQQDGSFVVRLIDKL